MPKQITPEQLAACGTEHGHQSALFCWAATQQKWTPALADMFAIPNGGQRGDGSQKGAAIAGGRFKAEGVRQGVPDIFLPYQKTIAGVCYNGLFIEMKIPKYKTYTDGGLSDEQKEWHNRLSNAGYYVATCYGWIEARDKLVWYIEVGR